MRGEANYGGWLLRHKARRRRPPPTTFRQQDGPTDMQTKSGSHTQYEIMSGNENKILHAIACKDGSHALLFKRMLLQFTYEWKVQSVCLYVHSSLLAAAASYMAESFPHIFLLLLSIFMLFTFPLNVQKISLFLFSSGSRFSFMVSSKMGFLRPSAPPPPLLLWVTHINSIWCELWMEIWPKSNRQRTIVWIWNWLLGKAPTHHQDTGCEWVFCRWRNSAE